MRIFVEPTDSATSLIDYLRRCACDAQLVGQNVVEASPRSGAQASHSRVELDGYLRVWRAMHPSAAASIVEQPRPVTAAGESER